MYCTLHTFLYIHIIVHTCTCNVSVYVVTVTASQCAKHTLVPGIITEPISLHTYTSLYYIYGTCIVHLVHVS